MWNFLLCLVKTFAQFHQALVLSLLSCSFIFFIFNLLGIRTISKLSQVFAQLKVIVTVYMLLFSSQSFKTPDSTESLRYTHCSNILGYKQKTLLRIHHINTQTTPIYWLDTISSRIHSTLNTSLRWITPQWLSHFSFTSISFSNQNTLTHYTEDAQLPRVTAFKLEIETHSRDLLCLPSSFWGKLQPPAAQQ